MEIAQSVETVLVVEDDEMLLDVVKIVLEGQGFYVLAAKDGAEALEIYAHHKDEIAVVLSDMGLPSLSGWEILHKMKGINPNAKIILSSGYSDPAIRSEMLKAGATEFVAKPYDVGELTKKMRGILETTV